MLSSLYAAVNDVLSLPPIVLGGNDYAPLVTACVSGILLLFVVLNVFAFLRALFCR